MRSVRLLLLASSLVGGMALCLGGRATAATSLPLATTSGYTATLFASGKPRYTHPTALASLNGLVYVGYANATTPDGSDGASSTVVAYGDKGQVSQTYALKGSISGLRADTARKMLYAVVNRLGNSAIYTITPAIKTAGQIALPAAPAHGGGFADIALVGAQLFVSASNPTLNDAGANIGPALDRLTITGATGTVTPLLMGKSKGIDVATNQTVDLNEVDPAALAVSPTGDLVLINQAGSELVFVRKPTTAKPTINSLLTGTQLVGVTWTAAGKGRLLVADGTANAVYAISGLYGANATYAISAADSGVSALLGSLNTATGNLKPFVFGFQDPTALLYTR